MKTLIVGREITGKATLRDELICIHKWQILKPMTYRECKDQNDTSFTFITQDEPINEKDILFKRTINNTDAFITKQQIQNADALIVHPDDINTIIEAFPDEWFTIVYMTPKSEDARENLVIKASNDPQKTKDRLNQIDENEKQTFNRFENSIAKKTFERNNLATIFQFDNPYDNRSIPLLAIQLNMKKRVIQKLSKIINQLIAEDIIKTEDNKIVIYDNNGNPQKTMQIEELAENLTNETPNQLSNLITHWLMLENTSIPDTQTIPKADVTDTLIET